MGKSIRAKIKKRFRTVKRQRVEVLVERPNLLKNAEKLEKIAQGICIKEKVKKNKFRYQEDPDAEVPQHAEITPLDFRSEALPMSGYAFKGGRRKLTPEEKISHGDLKITIPEAEADRLGLDQPMEMGDVPEMGDIPEMGDLQENLLSGAIVNGVKREVLRPAHVKSRKAASAPRKKMVMNGGKKIRNMKAR